MEEFKTLFKNIKNFIFDFYYLEFIYVILIIFGLFIISSERAEAGSGAGGIIKIVNNSSEDYRVSWAGMGCSDIVDSLIFVCEAGNIPKGKEQVYGYNWGVSSTWINVKRVSEESYPFRHVKVNTNAWSTNVCTIDEIINEKSETKETTVNCDG